MTAPRKIGFLGCPGTLPADEGGSSDRREDAFEHDLQIAALRPAFASANLELVELDWRAPLAAFADIALVLIGTAWDYQDYADDFIAKLDAIEGTGTILCNSTDITRWNINKNYLRKLSDLGAQTIPTLWLEAPTSDDVIAAFAHFDTDRVVVKRQTGAGAEGQYSFSKDAPPPADWRMAHPAMIQPFLPAIVEEGELTFVFIDGEFSHSVRKTAPENEYRIQSLYGGTEEVFIPSPDELSDAQAIMHALPFNETPLYARIDMIRLASGQLAVMEAELIEPYLYPVQGPKLGEHLAKAILKRLE
jgi:hypothetical protein